LPGVQAGERHRRVRRDRRVDVHRVDVRVGEQPLVALEPSLDAELVADLLQLLGRPLTDRVQLRVGVTLVDR
jgi:hypothetical protein